MYVYALSNGPAKLLGEIPLAETPSNLAFGDPDMESLYITARTSVYRVRLGVKGLPLKRLMSRQYPQHPLLGVGAIIFDGDSVLLVERAGEPLKGWWSHPRRPA